MHAPHAVHATAAAIHTEWPVVHGQAEGGDGGRESQGLCDPAALIACIATGYSPRCGGG